MKKGENKTNKQIAEQAIGLGAVAQLSRNKKINNLGWLGIYVGVITLIGELIKLPIKWLIIKPCIYILKGYWFIIKYSCIYTYAFTKTLFQYVCKGIKILINKYKENKKIKNQII